LSLEQLLLPVACALFMLGGLDAVQTNKNQAEAGHEATTDNKSQSFNQIHHLGGSFVMVADRVFG